MFVFEFATDPEGPGDGGGGGDPRVAVWLYHYNYVMVLVEILLFSHYIIILLYFSLPIYYVSHADLGARCVERISKIGRFVCHYGLKNRPKRV